LGMHFGPANDCMNLCDKRFAMEQFGQIIICAKSKSFNFSISVIRTEQDQDRGLNSGQSQLPQHFMPIHIQQVLIWQDQVIVIQLGQIDTLFPQIGGIYVGSASIQCF
jgi:hypothetical protein